MFELKESDAIFLTILINKIYLLLLKNNSKITDAFWYFQDNIEKDFMINRQKQSKILKRLKSKNIISTVRKGVPARNYYLLNWSKILKILNQKNEYFNSTDVSNRYIKMYHNDTCKEYKNKNIRKEDTKVSSSSFTKVKDEEDVPIDEMSIGTSSSIKKFKQHKSKKQQELKSVVEEKVSSHIKKVFDEYFAITGKKVRSINSKSYKESIEAIKDLIRGKFFNKTTFDQYRNKNFRLRDISEVFNRLKTSMEQDYYPVDKKYLKQPFKSFLYNRFATKNKSWFIYFYENKPKKLDRMPYVKLDIDIHPEITKKLRILTAKEIYKNINYEFSNIEENKLRKVALKISDFFNKNRNAISFVGKHEHAEIVFKALKTIFKDGFSIGNLLSNYTYSYAVPLYLRNIGSMENVIDE
ncbi:MAG: hypothetical protein KKB38_20775 [Gammaproteobacteria bacterium]|nr:hypothetical protein [Gammaproteobacteria bacterium]